MYVSGQRLTGWWYWCLSTEAEQLVLFFYFGQDLRTRTAQGSVLFVGVTHGVLAVSRVVDG